MSAGRPPKPPVQEDQLVCTRIVRALVPFRDRFLSTAEAHGNTELHLGDVLLVLLSAFFNPVVRSQRLIEQLSQIRWVKDALNVDVVCKSTLSDAMRRFDPQELIPLIQGLLNEIPHLSRVEGGDLEGVCRQILAADGSYWSIPADVAWALIHTKRNKKGQGQVRLNLQLDVVSFTPADLSISGKGDGAEAAAFIKQLKECVIYLVDRGFIHFGFINAVLEKDSDIVLRLRDSDKFAVAFDRPLTDKDVASGVRSDSVGRLPGSTQKKGRSRTTLPPERQLRLVVCTDPGTGKNVRLLTSLMDVPPHVISALYRQRWQIEIFFRWLKIWANFDHLLSHSPEGITLQFYVAVIACLLMHLATGRKVNKYTIFLLGQVAMGLATAEQVMPMLDKIEREKDLARARQSRKKALPQKSLPPSPA